MANNVMNCDLVVLGAGGSGLVAAVKAAEISGKKVIVLEKAKKAGGSTYFAHGFGVQNSKWQQEAGMPDTRDDMFRRTMQNLKWKVNHKLVLNYIYSSGPFFDWLVEKGGAEEYFKKPVAGQQLEGMMAMMGGISFPYRHMNKTSRDPSIGPGWMGSYVVTKMLEQCEKIGIPVLTETRAKEFITDAKGNVTGLLADAKDGRLQVNCKACVMAAGGFGANKEKLKKRWPEFCDGNRLHMFSCPTSDGDSLDMAENIGVHMDYKNMYWLVGGPAHHPYSYTIYRIMLQPEIVYVNLNGERFVDETGGLDPCFHALGKQPRAICYAIADENLKEMLGERLIANPHDGPTDIPINKDFRKDIAYEESLGGELTKKADTLEALAKKIDADPKNLVATIKRYNEFCENGRDQDFVKKPEYLIPIRKPPFYAFFGQRFSETTHGGIVINENTEVLNTNGKVMPGLFAVGDNAGGHTTESGGAGALGFAVVTGYMAGITAGEYISRTSIL
ncbi:FAD-binding protein [Deltaproteobacteria bacterium]|nr:FAD-binding protein [Deltaproteobacteria bacterium]